MPSARCFIPAVALLLVTSAAFGDPTVSGVVTDAGGNPVEGADVWLARCLYSADSYGTPVVDTAVTGADGRYALEDPDYGAVLQKGRWCVLAYRDGLAADGSEILLPGEQADLRLVEPQPFAGRLRSADGSPIAKASVHCEYWQLNEHRSYRERNRLIPAALAERFAVRTGDDGSFEIAYVPGAWALGLQISAVGYGTVRLTRQTTPCEVRLAPAGSALVRVTTPEGAQPAQGAKLRARRESADNGITAGASGALDDRGQLLLDELPPGAYRLSVRTQSEVGCHIGAPELFEVTSGKQTEVVVEGLKTVPVTGRVVARDTGEPLAGAEVAVYTEALETYTTRTQTGPDGEYSVPCIEGEFRVTAASADGFFSLEWGQQRPKVTVTPEGVRAPDISLTRKHPFGVLVVDQEGRPVKGATVRFHTDNSEMPSFGEHRTLPDGTCGEQLKWARPGMSFTLYAARDTAASEVVAGVQGQIDVPIRLVLTEGRAAPVTARIVDGDGNPIADARVTLREHIENATHYAYFDRGDADGVLSYSAAVPGVECRLGVQVEGADEYESEPWIAVAGEAKNLGTITIKRYEGTLAGTVVDAAGQPVEGALVYSSGDSPGRIENRTGADGRFRRSGIASEVAYAFVDAHGYRFTAQRAQVGTEDMRIALAAPPKGALVTPPRPLQFSVSGTEATQIAEGLLRQAVEQTGGSTAYPRERLLQQLARIDAGAAYESAIAHGEKIWPIDRVVAIAHMPESFNEALLILKAGAGVYDQVRGLIQAAEELTDGHPDLARRCLEETLTLTPTLSIPNKRVLYAVMVGEQMEKLDPERAAAIYEECAQAARVLGTADYEAFVRGYTAEHICAHDLPRALELVACIDEVDAKDRALSDIAKRLAKTDPEGALEVLKQASGSSSWARQATGEMLSDFPPEHRDRALERARGMSGMEKATALVRLAHASEGSKAVALLEEGADVLIKEATGYGPSPSLGHAQALAALAVAAKRMGYSEYEQYALRAASLRSRGAGGYVDRNLNPREHFELAECLAYTVPEIARHVIESTLEWAGSLEKLEPACYPALIQAAATLDLRWAAELVEQMPRDDVKAERLHRAEAVSRLVTTVGKSAEQRERGAATGWWGWVPEGK